ncbi:MAG: carbohydrate kinase [Desulfobulbaceae bacterium]|nr:carbohydrate kinase [Desulfobulbaceae bacterium]
MSQGGPLIFGEVLFDCFPDGREVLGGAPFNVAWNLQAFGQNPLFISRVGDDPQGLQIRKTMKSWSMNTDFVQYDPSRPTGRVEITLTNGEPRFAILPDQAYDHISPVFPQLKEKPVFLYHGSLALRDDGSRAALATLKRTCPCPIFLDVNLRQPWWNREHVLAMIEDAAWVKMNEDECYALFPEQDDSHSCGAMILDRFGPEGVFITMGSRGAAAFTPDSPPLSVAPDTATKVVDTVGAGDAFSSVLLLGIMLEWPLQLTLDRAQQFASGVVGQRGATSLDREFYQKFLHRWNL